MNYWGEGNHQNPPPNWFDNWGWFALVAALIGIPLVAWLAVLFGWVL